MKPILFLIFFILVNFNSYLLKAEEALTVKQQLDRIMQEVSDLNKAVFNKTFDKDNLNYNVNDTERFASIDIRIYDLEKDIQNLTLQFEEIIFKLDDLSNYMERFETEINLNLEDLKYNKKNESNKSNKENNPEELLDDKEEKNTLGTLVISEETSEILNQDKTILNDEESLLNQEIENLTAEEKLQFALDQMMKKKYTNSKTVLEKFITKFPDNQLSGSAHFWLGKIYQFESNYRKAAIVFGEGVQKFPKSIKAAEMYYELSKSLKEMNKFSEACKTLDILNQNYKDNKFASDPEKIKNSLNCNDEN